MKKEREWKMDDVYWIRIINGETVLQLINYNL